MNDITLLEDTSGEASNDTFSGTGSDDSSKKSGEILLKKASKKKVSKVSEQPVDVIKPHKKKPAKVEAKKANDKKVKDAKAIMTEPKPAKIKKAAAVKSGPAPKASKRSKKGSIVLSNQDAEAEALQPDATTTFPEPVSSKLVIPGNPCSQSTDEVTNVSPGKVDAQPEEPAAKAGKRSVLKKISFQLKFHTNIGQLLFVSGNHPLLGNNDPARAFPLSYLNEEYWVGTMEIPSGEVLLGNISYNYVLKNEDGTFSSEWGTDKQIETEKINAEEVFFSDSWNPSSLIENTFYTEPFQQVLLNDDFTEVDNIEPETITHIFRVKAPLLSKGQTICLYGSIEELGSWKNTVSPLLLSIKPGEVWHTISLDLSNANFPFSYKYGLFDINSKTFSGFESGNNRTMYDSYSPGKLTVVSDGFALLPFKPFKGVGVAIPVFSLRSRQSFGVGEFNDLKLLTDWAKQIGLKLLQLLPVNDTTATHTFEDSYPYAAISAFALHPLYLHLPAVIGSDNQQAITAMQQQEDLNSKADVDYVAVMKAKWEVIKRIFPLKKEETFTNTDFKSFFNENAHWLVPYAAFSYFREQNNTSEFDKWTSNQRYNAEQINALAADYLRADEAISVYYFVQYHLHLQLKDATNYAHQNGIIIKGDIPIGIYRNSCDAWQEPYLFNMDMQAGAPPDDFAVKGQNWGFPTYNWHRMAEDGFSWWKKRFHQMSYYFDAFRIDHILGFFRIWSIPLDAVQGIMGHFVPAIPIHVNELTDRGIYFTKERFCRPFIVDSILWQVFGNDSETVKATYLQLSAGDQYSIKPEFDTQRKVEAHFAGLENTTQNQHIKEGLYDLISNVIFFEEKNAGGQQFHFRIAVQQTTSFRYLDGHTQYLLQELYENYFFRRQDDFWMKEAMLKLPELKRSTNMLICGEDLGMVPGCVPGVMKELAILSLEIQRMPKNPAREFFHPNDAPYLSVVTPSTHDMSTIRGWWEENRSATQRFFNNELGQWGTAPFFCEPWINRIILMQHLYSPAMWSIFQLQDLLGISATLRRENPNDERINIPANPKHYWKYRMHLTLESLISQKDFTAEVRDYIAQCGR